jgi:hypothetical protein
MSMAGRRPMMTTSPYGSSLCRMVAVEVAELGRKNDVTHPSTFQNGRLLTNSIATTATLRKICMLSCAAPGVPWQMAQMSKKLCRVEGGMCQGTVPV